MWQAPVVVRDANGDQRVVLGAEPVTMTVAADGPVVVNAGGWGFFRVAYDDALAAARRRRARHAERARALQPRVRRVGGDARRRCRRRTPPSTCSRRIKDETEPGDVDAAARDRSPCSAGSRDSAGLQSFVRELAGPTAARLGWNAVDGEAETAGMVRGAVLELLGTLGHDDAVIAEAQRPRRRGRDAIPPRSPATSAAPRCRPSAATADEATFQTLLDGMRNATTPQEEQQYRFALAAVSHEALVRRVCDLCLTEIRSQDVSFVLIYLMQGKQQARRVGLDRDATGPNW